MDCESQYRMSYQKRLAEIHCSHALGHGCMLCNAGTAVIDGLDIRSDMADIYAMMGVCPQHDLLWETLTGREHLLFYGRLKNLKVKAVMAYSFAVAVFRLCGCFKTARLNIQYMYDNR